MALDKVLTLLFAVTLFTFANVAICEPQVKMLHVVFRHGEKVPHTEFQNYPNDPYRNHSYYPYVSGGLTNEGKMREYKIGKMLRERYDEFFGPVYWPDEIYARSTDIPRAQMSLQLVFAALFPPVGKQIWNSELPWQPVTTIYEPNEKDYLFFPHHCPLYKVEHRNFLENEETRRLIDEHRSTMEYLTKHSGKTVNRTEDVYFLYNLLREEKMQNLTLPEWTSKVYPNPMKDITILDFNLRAGTTKLKRLGGGIMLRKITEDMKHLCKKAVCPSGRKAFFFSGHEDTVARLSRALGTNDPLLPDYGSTIIIETLQDQEKNGAYFVRILLWPGAENENLITQKIPGCSEICPLDEFLRLLKDVIPDEYEYQCCTKSKNSKKNSGANTLSIDILLFTILPIIIGLCSGLMR